MAGKNVVKRDIIINSTNEETRIALCEDNKLSDLFIEQPDNERMIGDIYKGSVGKILPGMKAIFVNIGMANDGFMHFSDFEYTYDDFVDDEDEDEDEDETPQKKKPNKKAKQSDPTKDLKVGDEILVQITKEPISNKGCRITSKLTIPGRFVVLLPNERNIGVSRKIQSRGERTRLRAIARETLPKGFGLIIRTVCEGIDDAVLKRDIKNLLKHWSTIEKKAKSVEAPSIIYEDSGMTASIMRDLFSGSINSVVVDSRKEHRILKKYIREVAPELHKKLEYYSGNLPIFDHFYNIEKEVQRSIEKKVWMKNGGYLFIEHTEAFTSIDINSGRYIGKKNQDENSLKINIDAAREIARQVRLRDIGGLIMIDFIDMLNDGFKRKVYQELIRGFRKDKAVYNIAEMSRFCIIEMTRQRIRPSIVHAISDTCPRCRGTGLIASKETLLSRIERFIKRYRAANGSRILNIKVHPNFYVYLTEKKNNRVSRLMWKYWMLLKVTPDESVDPEKFKPLDKSGQQIVLK